MESGLNITKLLQIGLKGRFRLWFIKTMLLLCPKHTFYLLRSLVPTFSLSIFFFLNKQKVYYIHIL